MLQDTIKRYHISGKELVQGVVVGQLPDEGIRPVVEVRSEDPPIKTHARLMMNSVESIPVEVSFYYAGDPADEVHLREEANPVWFLIICILGPILLWAWDQHKRKLTPGKRRPDF